MTEETVLSSLPQEWHGEVNALIRLADPVGQSVAWYAPHLGGNCIAFAVRSADGWRQIFHDQGPEALRGRPSRFGLPILVPFPGDVHGGAYSWRGATYQLPLNATGSDFLHGFAHTHPWAVRGTGPQMVEAELRMPSDLRPENHPGYPFHIRLRASLSLAGTALQLVLVAVNEGEVAAPVALGLHPYFNPQLFGDNRLAVQVTLPGPLERVLSGANAGLRQAPNTAVRPAAPGAHGLVGRAGFADGAEVVLAGAPGGPRVTLRLLEGVREVLLFSPAEHPSISIEPLSGPLSAAGRPTGHPDAIAALEPGESRRLAVTITYQHP